MSLRKLRISAFVMAAALLMVSGASNVWAHAKLVSSNPAAGQIVDEPPSEVELAFSAAVQTSMRTIAVKNEQGERVDLQTVSDRDEGRVLTAGLSAGLPDGMYRIEWRVLSLDDHVISGDLAFEVRRGGGPPETEAAAQTAEQDHSGMDHSMHEEQGEINWAQSLVRWVMYLAMISLAGAFAFRIFVAGPAGRDIAEISPGESAIAALEGQRARMLATAFVSALVLIAAGVAALMLQAAAVYAEGNLVSLDPAQLKQVITETSFGPPWAMQMTCAATVLIVIILMRGRRPGRVFLWIGLVMSALILLAPSLTGHARAASIDYPPAILFDWLHLAAAAVWAGGLVQLAVTVPAMLRPIRGRERAVGLSAVLAGFHKLAIGATVTIILTGLYNSWIHVESFRALIESDYGVTLLAKAGVSALMIAIGGVNAFIIHPKIKRLAAEGEELPEGMMHLQRNVRVELALGAIVLMLAALLAFMPPAREHTLPGGERVSARLISYEREIQA